MSTVYDKTNAFHLMSEFDWKKIYDIQDYPGQDICKEIGKTDNWQTQILTTSY